MPTPRFNEIFLDRLKKLLGLSSDVTQDEVDAAFRAARAQAGGEASGAARQAPPTDAAVAASAAPSGTIRLAVYSTDERTRMAASGVALPDGSYPIPDVAALHDAVQAYGRSPDEATKAHIVKRARALGQTAVLPANWEGSTKVAAEDGEDLAPLYNTLRLDEGAGLPPWQPYHRIGNHGVHPRYGEIAFSKADGDSIIANHASGVLGREVPLDLHHGTSLDSEAAGWIEQFAWGQRGEGLSDANPPSGSGPILYAKVGYTPIGVAKLESRLYKHTSPEYDKNLSGRGPTALALALTNNPFLKHQRTAQGVEPPIVLDDASEQEPPMPDPTQLHMPPNLAPQSAQGATSTVPPSQTPPQPRGTPTGAGLGAMPGFAAGAACPNCGTKMAGGEHFCSNCGAKPAAGNSAYAMEATSMPEQHQIQLDATALQVQLAESQRRQSALESQMATLQMERADGSVRARVDAAIYQGVAPALANQIGAALLDLGRIGLALPASDTTVRLSADGDTQPVSLAAALEVVSRSVAGLLEAMPRMPLGRQTRPSVDAPPAGESAKLQDQAYEDAIKAKAAEMNRERGVPSRNGAGA